MSLKPSEPLRSQALVLADVAAAGVRWFLGPEGDAASAAAALKGVRVPIEGATDMAFPLREAVENAASAVADAQRWGAGADARFAAMCASLRDGAKALALAAEVSGGARAQALIEAKRLAAEVERDRLRARADAHDSPFFVDSVKKDELASRLSAAAEALHQACDALAGSLSE